LPRIFLETANSEIHDNHGVPPTFIESMWLSSGVRLGSKDEEEEARAEGKGLLTLAIGLG
jgi:hypothetical protein